MTETCQTPTRDCPIDGQFMQEHGAILEKIESIHQAVTNGNGLTQRMSRAEEFIAELKGGIKMLRLTVTAIGTILIILQILALWGENIKP